MTRKRTCFFLLFLLVLAACFGQTKGVKTAFLRVDNINKDPRYDYMSGMISGILLFDLSRAEGIILVDRTSLDDVLKEQELILSDLSVKEEIRVGQLIGATHLLRAGFVFLGDEVMVNLTLVEVESGKTTVLSERGRTENLLHKLAEETVLRLTGRELSFQSDTNDRSIISLKDEKPGSLTLYCQLDRAEIFLDEQFAGYTTGDSTVPFVMDKVPPGKHQVRIRLYGFGEIVEPEILFKDWERTVEIQTGRNLVVRAHPAFYNYRLGDLKTLYDEKVNLSLEKGKTVSEGKHDLSFTDRDKKKISVSAAVKMSVDNKELVITIEILYEGKKSTFVSRCDAGKRDEKEYEIGSLVLKTELIYYSEKNELARLRIERTDIDYEMWKKEKGK